MNQLITETNPKTRSRTNEDFSLGLHDSRHQKLCALIQCTAARSAGLPFKAWPLLSWRARPWFRTEPAVLSCNSSCYDWRWSQLRQQLWAWHRAENLRTKRFESLAKMTLMHHDAPVWHRKTFCVALHSLKITGGFVASSQDAATGTI